MLTGNKKKVYNLFKKYGKLTDQDIESKSDLHPNSIRPVRLSLEKMGLIRRLPTNGSFTIYKLEKRVDPETFVHKKKRLTKSMVLAKLRAAKHELAKLQEVLVKLIEEFD